MPEPDFQTVFSVTDLVVWDLFPWSVFAFLYAITFSILLFPKLSRVWPLSSFVLFDFGSKLNRIVPVAFVSLIAIPHFLFAYYELETQKKALHEGKFELYETIYSTPASTPTGYFESRRSLTQIPIGEQIFSPPGGILGAVLIDDIEKGMQPNAQIKIKHNTYVILEILQRPEPILVIQ